MSVPEHGALRRRLERERKARREAEAIAERVTAELYATIGDLEKSNRALEAANESIREFVAVASHDIRGPLAVILGAAELLRDDDQGLTDDQKREFLSTLADRGLMLSRLVDDLLTVSSLDLGVVETHIADVSVRLALERILHDLNDDSILIHMAAPDDLQVRADPDHLERILVNYISNARKYGEPPVEVRVDDDDAADFANVRVSDRGPGVPDEFVHRLFTKFARSNDARSRDNEGTGLGLSIVRGLALANGGDAWYEPNVPHGSCFGVKLPRVTT
jgi:signal transduction histidine kinase